MSRFKHLGVSFWRKDGGFGVIEAAITLPLFLVITFAVIEFGNMFLVNDQARDVSDDVADFLQANPNTSLADLQTFVASLGLGTLKNTGPDGENNVLAKIKIQSEKTMKTDAQFDDFCQNGGKNWSNPWVREDGDPNNDNNPYYIYICYPYTYKTVTPLSGLTGGALPETRMLRGKAVVYMNAQLTCPAGQFMSNRGGKPVCTQINVQCEEGKFLKGINGTTPDCRSMTVVKGVRFKSSTFALKDGVYWANPDECYKEWTETTTTPGQGSCSQQCTVEEYFCDETGACTWYCVEWGQLCTGPSITCSSKCIDGSCDENGHGCTSNVVCTKWRTVCTPPSSTTQTITQNNGLKNWSEYTNDSGQFLCSPQSVTDSPLKGDTNDCPAGTVQVGIHDPSVVSWNPFTGKSGYRERLVWCAPLFLKY